MHLESWRFKTRHTHPVRHIKILGDSFAFGHGVNEDQTLPHHLSMFSRSSVTCICKMGNSLLEIKELFKKGIKSGDLLKSSIVLYAFVINDVFINKNLLSQNKAINRNFLFRYLKKHPAPLQNFLLSVSNYSGFIRFITERHSISLGTRNSLNWYRQVYNPETNPNLMYSFSAISEMKEALQKHNIKFAVVFYPLMISLDNYPLMDVHNYILNKFRSMQIPVVDLLPVFKKHSNQTLVIHPEDQHPNALAHKIAAEATARALGIYDVEE